MVASAKAQEAESVGKEPLLPIRDLLPVAIDNNTYYRSLFNENYFSDKSVLELGMKIKKLMPTDVKYRRLIYWMENGVYDALQKKYLKTLLFHICEKEEGPMIEEYAFSFSYPSSSTEEVAMSMSSTRSKKGSTTFTSNASEVTPNQIRSSASKMIRTLVSLMRTLDPMAEERTILGKLLYYDDVTPADYEPLFFKCCADNEAINIWNKNPLKLEVGNANSNHLEVAFKVKSVLDPFDDNNVNRGDDGMSVDNKSDYDDGFSDTEVRPSEADDYVIDTADDTQDAAHEEELTAQVKKYICSREIGIMNVSDVLSNFPDISMEMVEDITERLLKYDVVLRSRKDECTDNQTVDRETPHIKEVIMQNISPTEGTKHSNDELLYMKVLCDAQLKHNIYIMQAIDTNANDNNFEIKDMVEGAVGCILCTNPTAKGYGSLDSGASNHITGNRKWLENLRPIPKDKENYFLNAAKEKVQVSEIGDIMSQNIRLYNVYHSNDLEDNELYVSIGQLTGEGYDVMINKGEVTIRLARNFNHIVGNGSLDHDLMAYMLEFFNGSVLERAEDPSEKNQGGGYVTAEGHWILDSGCHHHITKKKSFLKEKQKLEKKIELNVAGSGWLTCRFKGDVAKDAIKLKDVYLCHESRHNLISVSQLDVLGYNFLFSGDHCKIKYKDEEDLVGIAHIDSGNLNYYVEFLHSKE